LVGLRSPVAVFWVLRLFQTGERLAQHVAEKVV
jgi:hypothetical protein